MKQGTLSFETATAGRIFQGLDAAASQQPDPLKLSMKQPSRAGSTNFVVFLGNMHICTCLSESAKKYRSWWCLYPCTKCSVGFLFLLRYQDTTVIPGSSIGLSSQNSCWNWTTWDRILSITQTYPNQWLVEVFPQWFYDVEAGHFITPCWLWLFNRVESPLLIPLTLSFSWIISPYFHDCLVGGFNHLEKYARQLGWLFPI